MSGDDYLWDKTGAPDPEVERLEQALAPLRYVPRAAGAGPRPLPRRPPAARRSLGSVVLLIAASLGALAGVVAATGLDRTEVARRPEKHAPHAQPSPSPSALAVVVPPGSTSGHAPSPPSAPSPPLEITRVAGAPRVASGALTAPERFGVGDWVETDATSRARVVLDIGNVEVEPGSRLSVAALGANEQRLDLARGAISARVDAPPRLFMVDTPAARAVDLGCAYRLEVKEDGSAWLRVTTGYVSLEGGKKTALVPAGAVCRTRAGVGPGTPRFTDAPAALVAAVDRFDETGEASAALAALPPARARDSLTLWHLLFRVPEGARARVFERLRALVPPPEGVGEAQAEALDRAALRPYKERLRVTW